MPKHYSVKEAVFPFMRFPGIDIVLGPEMKSTGEVMGIDADLGLAYAKSQMAAPPPLPKGGNIFISVKDDRQTERAFDSRASSSSSASNHRDQRHGRDAGRAGIPVTKCSKFAKAARTCSTWIKNGEIHFIINTPSGKIPREDEVKIRSAALAAAHPDHDHPSRRAGERERIRSLQKSGLTVKTLQEYHASSV